MTVCRKAPRLVVTLRPYLFENWLACVNKCNRDFATIKPGWAEIP